MNREEVAQEITGAEYPFKITNDVKEILDFAGLVILYGASDDIMKFAGAICGEVDCYDGGTAYLYKNDLLQNECDDSDCPYFNLLMADAQTIEALWCDEPGLSWTYKTKIPHSTFEIMEGDDVYCRGIVFDVGDIAK